MIEAIKITGRFASLALFAIIFEGMLTLGSAFKFEYYGPLAWIVQCLILVLCVWGAAEWTEAVKKDSKSW
jgi:hypothetical protein